MILGEVHEWYHHMTCISLRGRRCVVVGLTCWAIAGHISYVVSNGSATTVTVTKGTFGSAYVLARKGTGVLSRMLVNHTRSIL